MSAAGCAITGGSWTGVVGSVNDIPAASRAVFIGDLVSAQLDRSDRLPLRAVCSGSGAGDSGARSGLFPSSAATQPPLAPAVGTSQLDAGVGTSPAGAHGILHVQRCLDAWGSDGDLEPLPDSTW